MEYGKSDFRVSVLHVCIEKCQEKRAVVFEGIHAVV